MYHILIFFILVKIIYKITYDTLELKASLCFSVSLLVALKVKPNCNKFEQKRFKPALSGSALGVVSVHTASASSKAVTLSRMARSSCLTAEVWVESNAYYSALPKLEGRGKKTTTEYK